MNSFNDYRGGLYDTAESWKKFMQLAEQKAGGAEAKPEVVKGLGEEAVRKTEPVAQGTEETANLAVQASENLESESTEMTDEEKEAAQAETREELEKWIKSLQGTPEEYWKKLEDFYWIEQNVSMDSYRPPRIDLLQAGARKILHEKMPNLPEEELEAQVEMAVKVALQGLAEQEAKSLAEAPVDRKGKRRLSYGWEEKLLHEAYHEMQRILEEGLPEIKPVEKTEEPEKEEVELSPEVTTEEFDGVQRLLGQIEQQVEVLPDYDERKAMILQKVYDMKASLVGLEADYRATRPSIEDAERLRARGIEQDEGNALDAANVAGALSIEQLYTEGVLSREKSARENLETLKVAREKVANDINNAARESSRLMPDFLKAKQLVQDAQAVHAHGIEFLNRTYSTMRFLEKMAEKEEQHQGRDRIIEAEAREG